jgi:hypothetical protein
VLWGAVPFSSVLEWASKGPDMVFEMKSLVVPFIKCFEVEMVIMIDS